MKFHRIWMEMEISMVKWTPGLASMNRWKMGRYFLVAWEFYCTITQSSNGKVTDLINCRECSATHENKLYLLSTGCVTVKCNIAHITSVKFRLCTGTGKWFRIERSQWINKNFCLCMCVCIQVLNSAFCDIVQVRCGIRGILLIRSIQPWSLRHGSMPPGFASIEPRAIRSKNLFPLVFAVLSHASLAIELSWWLDSKSTLSR